MSFLKPQSRQISNRIQSTSIDQPGYYTTEQGRPLIPPQCYLKMDVIVAVEVVGVRYDIEPEVTCQRAEESPVDENTEIFNTILVGESIETARGKLEILKD